MRLSTLRMEYFIKSSKNFIGRMLQLKIARGTPIGEKWYKVAVNNDTAVFYSLKAANH